MTPRPGWRILVSSLVMSVLAVGAALAPAPASAPAPGPATLAVAAVPSHSDPVARASPPRWPRTRALLDEPGRLRIRALLVRHLRASPPGSVVQGVVWAYDSQALTSALVRTARSGVRVRVLVGGISCGEPAFVRLRRTLRPPSYAGCVRGSARGGAVFDGAEANLHQKSWTFSRVGRARWVSVVTTANATEVAERHQYNDAYEVVGHRELYRRLGQVFEQQARDRAVAHPFRHYEVGRGVAVTFLPWNSPGQADPVVERIRGLPGASTTILVAQSNWQDERGVAIARALVGQRRAGATVRVLASQPLGRGVRAVLRAGGIPVSNTWWGPHRYSHLKFMAVRYATPAGPRSRVWTGSENWWSPSRGHDELVLRDDGGPAFAAYQRIFRIVRSA